MGGRSATAFSARRVQHQQSKNDTKMSSTAFADYASHRASYDTYDRVALHGATTSNTQSCRDSFGQHASRAADENSRIDDDDPRRRDFTRHTLRDAAQPLPQCNTENDKALARTSLTPGRVASAPTTSSASILDPQARPSDRVAARVAAAFCTAASGGYSDISASCHGGAHFAGAPSVGAAADFWKAGPRADARPGWSTLPLWKGISERTQTACCAAVSSSAVPISVYAAANLGTGLTGIQTSPS